MRRILKQKNWGQITVIANIEETVIWPQLLWLLITAFVIGVAVTLAGQWLWSLINNGT